MKFEDLTPAMQKRLVAIAEGGPVPNAGDVELMSCGLERRNSIALTEDGIRCYKTREVEEPDDSEETSLVHFAPKTYTLMGFGLMLATILGLLL